MARMNMRSTQTSIPRSHTEKASYLFNKTTCQTDSKGSYLPQTRLFNCNGLGSKKNKGKSAGGLLKPEKSGNIKDAFMKAAESRPKVPKAAPV